MDDILKLLLTQLLQQRLGVFQVGGVEALGEPVVDFRKHAAGLVAAIGVAQQTSEADDGAHSKDRALILCARLAASRKSASAESAWCSRNRNCPRIVMDSGLNDSS